MISASEIEQVLAAEIALIKAQKLRSKVVEAWVEACKRGGWESIDELCNMPFTLLAETKGISFLEHTKTVTQGAVGLAKAQLSTYKQMPYEINMDRLVVGALLHDIGKLIEIEPDGEGGFRKSKAGKYERHPISGAILAASLGLGEDIVNIIACHAKEGNGAPQVIETILIHQADFATFNPLVMKEKGLLIE